MKTILLKYSGFPYIANKVCFDVMDFGTTIINAGQVLIQRYLSNINYRDIVAWVAREDSSVTLCVVGDAVV